MKDYTANPFRKNAHLTYTQVKKKPNRAFSYVGEPVPCHKCHKEIKLGSSARYDDHGNLHHTIHRKVEKTEVACERCWLVHPGECE